MEVAENDLALGLDAFQFLLLVEGGLESPVVGQVLEIVCLVADDVCLLAEYE